MLLMMSLIVIANVNAAEQTVKQKYGLYATSSDKFWRDPCQIKYQIRSLAVSGDSQNYVLISSHHQLDYLQQLKRKYSANGLDQPDGKVKLQACQPNPQQQSNLDILFPTTRPVSASEHESQTNRTKNNGYFVKISLTLLPQGYWPYNASIITHEVATFVRDRQIQCILGPMYQQDAKQWQQRLVHNRDLLMKLLGDRVANRYNRFVNRSNQCVLNPPKPHQ